MTERHIPVLADTLMDLLSFREGGIYLDGTYGLGGHSALMVSKVGTTGRVYGLEWDPRMYQESLTKELPSQVEVINTSYAQFDFALASRGVTHIDGALLDLGISSVHADEDMGFSFRNDGPLDFRFNPETPKSAADIIAESSEEQLAELFWKYGEERLSGKAAHAIVRQREKKPFTRTLDLVDCLEKIFPHKGGYPRNGIQRIFQALRIFVNGELDNLQTFLSKIPEWLSENGWVAVISFHSLEDRIVKETFQTWVETCICPAGIPKCSCGRNPDFQWYGKKHYKPTQEEISSNRRARSSILRVVRKIEKEGNA